MLKLACVAAVTLALLLGNLFLELRHVTARGLPETQHQHNPRLTTPLPPRAPLPTPSTPAPSNLPSLPAGLTASPQNEAELERLVTWMRSLPPEELALAADAEHRFRASALVRSLLDVTDPRVVQALGALAQAETDPLVKAVLVAGFAGEPRRARYSDPAFAQSLRGLLAQLDRAESDPHEVAQDVVMASYIASLAQKSDLAEQLAAVLARSDNPQLLVQGHLVLNGSENGRAFLRTSLLAHPHRDGRMGAIEGLRTAAALGRISAAESAALFLDVLASEQDERNRSLALEALASTGGPAGEQALRRIVLDPDAPQRGEAMVLLAGQLPASEALELMESALLEPRMDAEVKRELYCALARIPADEGPLRVLAAAQDPSLAPAERVAALDALGTASAAAALAGGLLELTSAAEPPEVRAEALRVLVERTEGAPQVDLWALAQDDSSPLVRARAVELAAFSEEPDAGTRLLERSANDPDPEVRSAALGALVARARYESDPRALERLLAALESAPEGPGAEQLAQLRQALKPDPARAKVELAGDARFWREIERHLEGHMGGVEARAAALEARQLERKARSVRGPAAAGH